MARFFFGFIRHGRARWRETGLGWAGGNGYTGWAWRVLRDMMHHATPIAFHTTALLQPQLAFPPTRAGDDEALVGDPFDNLSPFTYPSP